MLNIVDFKKSIIRLKNIVRAYDIRGTIPDELNDHDGFVLGYILGQYFKKIATDLLVVIGTDNRITSFSLSNATIAGLSTYNIPIKQLGIISTSELYYEAFISNVDRNTLGIMVTASHNPFQYNGFKIVFNSKIVDGNMIIDIINQCDIQLQHQSNNNYINYLINRSGLDNIKDIQDKKIIWDCNNGATQQLINELMTRLPNHNTVIGCNKYIEDIPDPTNNINIKRVQSMIHNHDLALCFDGDGDRLVLINHNGRVLRGDKILLILAAYYARNVGEHKAVVDIKTSRTVIKNIQDMGFEVTIQKTGHSFIKKMMCQKQAIIGGEVSGHIFFKFIEFDGNYIAYDDALLAACYILKIFLSEPDFIENIIQNIPEMICEYDLKVYCNSNIQDDIINHIKSDLIEHKLHYIDIDGIKYEDDNSWWLIRKSNTEEMLIICIEGNTKDAFEKSKQYLNNKLMPYNLSLN